MTDNEGGRYEALSSGLIANPPDWAMQLQWSVQAVHNDVRQILRKQVQQVALSDDLKAQITALQNEDGVIIAALNDLKAKAAGGTVSDTDVQAAIDQIKAELSRVDEVVQVDDPSVEPPAPTPPAGP